MANPQTNGATSRDWLEANKGIKIIAYVETATQAALQRPHPSSDEAIEDGEESDA